MTTVTDFNHVYSEQNQILQFFFKTIFGDIVIPQKKPDEKVIVHYTGHSVTNVGFLTAGVDFGICESHR